MANLDSCDEIIIAGDLNAKRREDYSESLWNLITQEDAKQAAIQKQSISNSSSEALLEEIKKIEQVEETRGQETMVLDHLQTNGFIDCFALHSVENPTSTTWAGTRVDFILCNNRWSLPIDTCAVYYNAASDHLPVVMDIQVTY